MRYKRPFCVAIHFFEGVRQILDSRIRYQFEPIVFGCCLRSFIDEVAYGDDDYVVKCLYFGRSDAFEKLEIALFVKWSYSSSKCTSSQFGSCIFSIVGNRFSGNSIISHLPSEMNAFGDIGCIAWVFWRLVPLFFDFNMAMASCSLLVELFLSLWCRCVVLLS